MQEVEIDNHILLKPPTLIDEKHLDLKLNTSGNITSQKLIEQINEKINYLDSKKATVEELFNKKMTHINNSENGDVTDLSSKIKQPLQTADSISSDIQKIKDRFIVIKKNIEKLMQLKDSDQKREMLKKLKEEALRLKDFYEIYEKLKYFYENRDFIQVSVLYNQILKLNIGDKIKLVDDLLSPTRLIKTINDELFKNCQNEFSFMSLFQCLIFIKDPFEVVQIITYNKKFDFKGITNFDQILDNYRYRFDVIYAIFELKNKKNIVDMNGNPWKMPSEIWNALSNPKINFFNIVAQSFYNFVYNLDTQQNPLLPVLLNKWDNVKSLLFLTNSYSIIAFKIVSDILKNGNEFNSNNDPLNRTGLLYQNLNECYIIYQNQNEKNYREISYSCEFIKNLIESIIVLLIRSLINNPFNQSQDHSKEMVDYINKMSKAILKSDSLLDELKIKSKINVELIQCDFQKIFKLIHENDSLMTYFKNDNFLKNIIESFIPKFLYYSIPTFIGENVKEYCQNEEKFKKLKLKETFNKWSVTYNISESSLRKIALKYFIFCKPHSLFSIRFIEPDHLFSIYYPPPPS